MFTAGTRLDGCCHRMSLFAAAPIVLAMIHRHAAMPA